MGAVPYHVAFNNGIKSRAYVSSIPCYESLESVFYCIFQGLYLIRDIPLLITEGGFQIEQMEVSYVIPFPKSSSYCSWDVALLQ